MAAVGVSSGQTTKVNENCDLAILGAKESDSFISLDNELRDAMIRHDAAALSLLVSYPLRVNESRGKYLIPDPRSLQTYFDKAFVPAVRNIVLNRKRADIACNYQGLMYGLGTIWVNLTDHGYAMAAVNVPDSRSSSKRQTGQVQTACNADSVRAIVDIGDDGTPRYRAWNKPHSIVTKPDFEIADGTEGFEGTGPCAYAVWKFVVNGSNISVESGGLGCFEESHQPPTDAIGRLVIKKGEGQEVSSWCF